MIVRRGILAAAAAAVMLAGLQAACGADEPALPAGLAETSTQPAGEPDLPAGLGGDQTATPELPAGLDGDEPGLPPGLQTPMEPASEAAAASSTFAQSLKDAGVGGFLEVRGGVRTQNDPYEAQAAIGESRLQLEWAKVVRSARLKVTGDLVYDQVDDDRGSVDIRRGYGFFDLREAWISFSPLPWMDAKVGRQTLTWGTGDLLFLNDMFPKDWQAFFIGRDLEYLKAPSDAAKVSVFSRVANLDLVYMPLMNPSRFISGRRLSYYNPMLGRLAGRDAIIDDDLPSEWFRDGDYAARLSRRAGSYELAAYGYWGFYRTPEGFDPVANQAFYPRLNTYGGSVRGPLGRGIANAEVAYYDSREDRRGANPLIPNSQVRLLAGYEMDLPSIAPELTLGLQYYVEIMMDHDAYLRALGPGMSSADECRHVVTVRLTKLLLNQNLTLSLFAYYSPTDNDAYLRPKATYKIDDHWTAEIGANVFIGERVSTFFGQFRNDSNIHASLRYSF